MPGEMNFPPVGDTGKIAGSGGQEGKQKTVPLDRETEIALKALNKSINEFNYDIGEEDKKTIKVLVENIKDLKNSDLPHITERMSKILNKLANMIKNKHLKENALGVIEAAKFKIVKD